MEQNKYIAIEARERPERGGKEKRKMIEYVIHLFTLVHSLFTIEFV